MNLNVCACVPHLTSSVRVFWYSGRGMKDSSNSNLAMFIHLVKSRSSCLSSRLITTRLGITYMVFALAIRVRVSAAAAAQATLGDNAPSSTSRVDPPKQEDNIRVSTLPET